MSHVESTRQSILTGHQKKESKDLDPNGQPIRTVEEKMEVVAQQLRKLKIVSEYWPAEKGAAPKLKKVEKYSDGYLESVSEYDKDGKLVKTETMVPGCENIKATDLPTGKMIEAQDDRGRRIFKDKNGKKYYEEILPKGEIGYLDEQGHQYLRKETPPPGSKKYFYVEINTITRIDDIGEPQMEPEVTRTMTFTAEGKEVKITTYEAMKKEKGDGFTKNDYIKYLAANLKTPEQLHAFTQLMIQYRYDHKEGVTVDIMQTWDQTVERTANGRMLGDCEDYALLMQRILEEQGKKSYAVTIPGHAEAIVITQDSKGKFHAASYGTFGVDIDGNRVGGNYSPERAEGYNTVELAIRSLQTKWSFAESGNYDMQEGSPLHKDDKGYHLNAIVPRDEDEHLDVSEIVLSSPKHKFAWIRIGDLERDFRRERRKK